MWIVFRRSRVCQSAQDAWVVLIVLSGVLIKISLALEEAWNQEADLNTQPTHYFSNSHFSKFALFPSSFWLCVPQCSILVSCHSSWETFLPQGLSTTLFKKFLFLTFSLTFQHEQGILIIYIHFIRALQGESLCVLCSFCFVWCGLHSLMV